MPKKLVIVMANTDPRNGEELGAPIAVERPDAEDRAAADGAGRQRQVAIDDERLVVEDVAEIAVEERRL